MSPEEKRALESLIVTVETMRATAETLGLLAPNTLALDAATYALVKPMFTIGWTAEQFESWKIEHLAAGVQGHLVVVGHVSKVRRCFVSIALWFLRRVCRVDVV